MTISLHTKTETSTQNNGWRMSIMETIGMTLTGGKKYQGRNGTSSGIGTLENCHGFRGISFSQLQ
jgi:hypothetical protein